MEHLNLIKSPQLYAYPSGVRLSLYPLVLILALLLLLVVAKLALLLAALIANLDSLALLLLLVVYKPRITGLNKIETGTLGFEPRITGPKPVALPLGYIPICK